MYCKKCGAKINEDATFCSECGAPISGNSSPNAVVPKKSNYDIWIVIFTFLLFFIGVYIIGASLSNQENSSDKMQKSALEKTEKADSLSPEEQQKKLKDKVCEQLFEQANKMNPGVLRGPQSFRNFTQKEDGTYEVSFSYHEGYETFTYIIKGIVVDNSGRITSIGKTELMYIKPDADKPAPSGPNAEDQYRYYQEKVSEGNRYGGW